MSDDDWFPDEDSELHQLFVSLRDEVVAVSSGFVARVSSAVSSAQRRPNRTGRGLFHHLVVEVLNFASHVAVQDSQNTKDE